jgi:hypothetical protein
VGKDVAFCRNCNLSHSLADLTHGMTVDRDVNLGQPPAGAWHRQDGQETIIGASHRSVGAAIFSLAFCLFWNGILSIFVLIALSGTLWHLGVPMPHWFPAPEVNGGSMGVGMTIFLWIFLLPFIAVGLGMLGYFLLAVAGRTELSIRNTEAAVFTGVGRVGYRRRFDPTAVQDVKIAERQWRDSDGDRRNQVAIVIENRAGKQVKFGGSLTPERRRFLASAARKELARHSAALAV